MELCNPSLGENHRWPDTICSKQRPGSAPSRACLLALYPVCYETAADAFGSPRSYVVEQWSCRKVILHVPNNLANGMKKKVCMNETGCLPEWEKPC